MKPTPQEQNIAIAEILGWKRREWKDRKGKPCSGWRTPDGKDLGGYPPNYTGCLNACAEMEQALTHKQHLSFRKYLWDTALHLGPEDTWDRHYVSATPTQRCEAFLRVNNAWGVG